MTASASKQVSPSTAAIRRLSADEIAEELDTLRRLKQQVEIAMGCIQAGLTVQGGYNYFADTLWDMRIGDFLITDTKRGGR